MQQENFYNYRCKPEFLSVNFGRKIFSVCKRGRGHVENETVCQDYCAAEKISDNIFVMTVADGHGGEKYFKSDVGSKKACETLIEIVKEYSPLGANQLEKKLRTPLFKFTLIDKWRLKVLKDYKTENPETKDSYKQIIERYGTTLLFAVITNLHIIFGQIGDGAIMLFNDSGQFQLFKRHNPKKDSHTASMASSRAVTAFLIESYSLTDLKFKNFILSTDGIYDKLDQNNSFQLYADNLVTQVRQKKLLEILPFNVNEIDVSEKTRDDCTVAVMVAPSSDEKFELNEKNFEQFNFKRTYTQLAIYSAFKDNVNFELHKTPKFFLKENYSLEDISEKVKLLEPCQDLTAKNFYTYQLPENICNVHELIEHGEHLEKKFSEDPDVFSNKFWLEFYENILELKKFFDAKKYFVEDTFFKTLAISKNTREIFIFKDTLSQLLYRKNESDANFAEFLSYFNFLGKIECGNSIQPLFKSVKYFKPQIVPSLHDGEKNFCCVVYNDEKKIFGLRNLSEKIWRTVDKKIEPNQILTLTTNQIFKVFVDENNFVEYKLTLF